MFLRKTKPAYSVTKLYFWADRSAMVDFVWFQENVFSHCIGPPIAHSINYDKDTVISKLPARGRQLTFGELEAFDCSDAAGRVVFSLGIAGTAFETRDDQAMFGCLVIAAEEPSHQNETELIEKFSRSFQLRYAYVRLLPVDFSPVSEEKIKSGFFGRTTKVGRVQDGWLCDPKSLSAGGVKGIYLVNFWNSGVSDQLAEAGIKLSPSGREGIVVFDQKDLESAVRANPEHKKFIYCK